MPHTTRKSLKTRQNRRHIEDDDGWTHVVRGPAQKIRNWETLAPETTDEPCVGEKPTVVKNGLTLDKAQKLYAGIARKWKETACWQELERVFRQQVLKLESLNITTCICLGLGSLTSDNAHGRPETCMHQLAALESMLDLLSQKHTIENVYVQDPLFNALDEKLLQALGFQILQRPAATDVMTSNTFIFTPCVTWKALLPIFTSSFPDLMVGNDIKMHLTTLFDSPSYNPGDKAPEYRQVFYDFIRKRLDSTSLLPKADYHTGMNDLRVYWKPDPEHEQAVPEDEQIER